LPNSWVCTSLDEIRISKRKTLDPRKTPNKVFTLYSVPSFAEGRPEIIAGAQIGSNKAIVEPGTVLLCKINPRINRVWVVSDNYGNPRLASTEWLTFEHNPVVDPWYLCYYLRTDKVRDHMASNVSGVGGSLMRARESALVGYPFPLAPLPEQHRIVAKIEELFSHLDAAVAALKRAQRNLKRYRAAVLKAAVEGRLVPTEAELARAEGRSYESGEELLQRILAERRRRWEEAEWEKLVEKAKKKAAQARRKAAGLPARLRDIPDEEWQDLPEEAYARYLPKDDKWKQKYKEPEPPDTSALPPLPEGWVWATVETIGALLRGVSYPKAESRDGFVPGLVPLLRATNIQDDVLTLDDKLVFIPESRVRKEQFLQLGDIVICTSSGSKDLVGKAAPLSTDWKGTFGTFLGVVRPLTTLCAPFVATFFISPLYRERIKRIAMGININNLRIGQLASLPFPLPPLSEQERIACEIDRRLAVERNIEAAVDSNLKRAERLRQAILTPGAPGPERRAGECAVGTH